METGYVPPMGGGGAMPPGMSPMWQPPMSAPQPAPQPQKRKYERPAWMTDEYLLTKFSRWDKDTNSHWSAWRSEARTCYDVTAGRQWEKGAEDDAKDKSITIVSINKTDATVSAICGSEMTNRQEVRYYPRETSTRGPDGQLSDVVVNEVFTAAAEWVRDECDAADEESEAFRDVLICGLGALETRMDYETDPEGMAIVQRIDPLEIYIDSASRRGNAVDARYIRRERGFPKDEARERFGIEEGGQAPQGDRNPHDNYAGSPYKGGEGETRNNDDVWICEYQWFELERVVQVVDPATQEIIQLTPQEFEKAQSFLPSLNAQQMKVRRYYRAFSVGDAILECTPLPDEEFTLKVITGKLDRNHGVWYGVVRALIDPQRLLNKQVSQIQRIIDTNAKGGLLAETGVFEDFEQAKEDWAASDSIVEVAEGSLAQTRVIPKPISGYPAGIDKLLMVALDAVPGTSGVNNEMLGLIDREQAGVVDVQRKEAAYGVLKCFFNSLRRYRKEHGRHLLKLIQKYMTNGRLIRIVGRTGAVSYLPLIRDPNTAKFDTIIDEAPTGPNQKDKVFQFLAMFGGPLLGKLNLPPQIMLKFLEFSPLPSALVAEIMQEVKSMPPQPNPDEEKAKGEAAKAQATLQQTQMQMQMDQQRMQMEAQVNTMKMQMEMEKLRGANQKLMMENEWVKLEMQKTAMEQQNSNQEAMLRARETQMREKNDTMKIEADVRQMDLDNQVKHAELDIKRAELQLKDAELGLKHEELGVKREEIGMRGDVEREKLDQADRHGEAQHDLEGRKIEAKQESEAAKDGQPRGKKLSSMHEERQQRWGEVSKSISDLTETMKRPRRIVRDANGRAVGLE